MNIDDSRPSWASTPVGQKNYYPALDGLRGFAILLVVTFHCFNHIYEGGGKLAKLILMGPHLGWVGVPIFFCLSGFLVTLPFWKAKEKPGGWWPKNYTAKRVIRIIPSFYLSIVFSAVLGGIVYGEWAAYGKAALLWLLGIGLYVPSPVDYFNGPYWSLIVEMQFYVLLPFLFLFCRNLNPKITAWIVVGFTVAISVLSRWITVSILSGGTSDEVTRPLMGYFSPMDLFALGMIFSYMVYYKIGLQYLRAIPYWILITGLLLFGVLGQPILRGRTSNEPFSWTIYELRHAFSAVASFILILVQLHVHSFFYWFFSRKWIIYLGAISYEWYLFHDPVRWYVVKWAEGTTGYWESILFGAIAPFILGLLFTIAVHHGFYLPVSAFLRKRFVK
jgi:peptidoglycan/LPS O-acetylase OafA/YrhL